MRKIDRFLQFLKYKGINENKATIDCGLGQGLLYQAKSGKADLGQKTIEKILITYQDLDRIWLLTGEGEMLRNGAIIQQIGNKSSNNMQVAGGSDVAMLKKENEHLKELLVEKERLIKVYEKMMEGK